MSKGLSELDAAFENIDLEAPEKSKKDASRNGFVSRNSAAHEISEGKRKTASQRYVDPAKCKMWRRHNRIYELLNPTNCQDLINDIRAKKAQIEPAIARPLKGDPDGYEYEIIAGARRHFSVSYLREVEGLEDLYYLVEVRRITDVEAFLISDAENKGRKDISDYERALDYHSALHEFYDENVTKMSEAIGVPRTSLRHYMNLAKLPKNVIRAFYEPTDIALRAASQLTPLINDPNKRGLIEERALEISKEQHDAKAIGKAIAHNGAAVVQELIKSATESTRKRSKVSAKKEILDGAGNKAFELEVGRKYLTFKVPIGQCENSTEVSRLMKKELAIAEKL